MTQLNRMGIYIVTALFLLAASPLLANGSQVYFNDFDGGLAVAPGISAALGGITTEEPVQGYVGYGTGSNTFGGNFLRNTSGGGEPPGVPGSLTTLTLTGLPPHISIDINFLLAIIDSWDGTEPGGPGGCGDCHPDILTVTVDGNNVFSEAFGFNGPIFIPPPGVLLVEYVLLGFNPDNGDAAFDMGLNPTFDNIPHTADSLTIEWVASGDGWQGGDDESWAIDNLEVVLNTVALDIKPGSDPNSINCNNEKGVVTVAILTAEDFDATTVDHATVTFEGASETHADKKSAQPRRHEKDADSDGDTDLVFHFRLGDTNLTCDSTLGTLTGETFDGLTIEGADAVRMVD